MAICSKCGKTITYLIINEKRDYKEIFCHHPDNLEEIQRGKIILVWGGKGKGTYSYSWLCPECMQPIFPDGSESQKLVEEFLKNDILSIKQLNEHYLKLGRDNR
jgi:hypothetical protein